MVRNRGITMEEENKKNIQPWPKPQPKRVYPKTKLGGSPELAVKRIISELEKMVDRADKIKADFVGKLGTENFFHQLEHTYRICIKVEQGMLAAKVLKIAKASNVGKGLEKVIKELKDCLVGNQYAWKTISVFDNAISEARRDASSRTLSVFENLMMTYNHIKKREGKEK